MVDLTVPRPDDTGVRLLDLVPARSGKASAAGLCRSRDMLQNLPFTWERRRGLSWRSQHVAMTAVPDPTGDP